MDKINSKRTIASILLLTVVLSSCARSAKDIDNILPDHRVRIYGIADLIPYNHKELRNAQASYGIERMKFFLENTTTAAEAKRVTDEDKNKFYSELRYINTNYLLLRNRLNMYEGDVQNTKEENESERKKEYDEYYKLQNAKSGGIIKHYNNGKLQGMPLMSIRVDMSTATMSEIDSLYCEAQCEIYRPTVINEADYQNLKDGDEIEMDIPIVNSTYKMKETKRVKFTYRGNDRLSFINESGEEKNYYIADIDGTNDFCRRIINEFGNSIEVYVEKKPLQFIKYAEVSKYSEPQRLMTAISNGEFVSYDFTKLAVRALGGGYYVIEYKDYVYANSITTNSKGYITALREYYDLSIDKTTEND